MVATRLRARREQRAQREARDHRPLQYPYRHLNLLSRAGPSWPPLNDAPTALRALCGRPQTEKRTGSRASP